MENKTKKMQFEESVINEESEGPDQESQEETKYESQISVMQKKSVLYIEKFIGNIDQIIEKLKEGGDHEIFKYHKHSIASLLTAKDSEKAKEMRRCHVLAKYDASNRMYNAMDSAGGLILRYFDLKTLTRLTVLNRYWKKIYLGKIYNNCVKDVWYWQNMDNKIMLRIVQYFDHICSFEFRKC